MFFCCRIDTFSLSSFNLSFPRFLFLVSLFSPLSCIRSVFGHRVFISRSKFSRLFNFVSCLHLSSVWHAVFFHERYFFLSSVTSSFSDRKHQSTFLELSDLRPHIMPYSSSIETCAHDEALRAD
mmetsp:Transcript_23973/g.47083  ORF Transcript_23973/g.47083 Transcript_23973/m.47083 type:complete len:124 (-) Transcript_23973:169-540(-)